MSGSGSVERRRQFCARCGQLMFEYFRSPDGHFGLVDLPNEAEQKRAGRAPEVRCPTCGARYRLLDQLDPMGRPIVRS
jgi:DNA-directed RNA polymerase subunit RPC12/RpoP